ncbi:hypothetical protein FNV43_RR21665 [Rhamnella rubrinervis]|uniref:Uncharacterized protein n=1 Tax=Rhamnella rubrinervis TaxID=2594499 RepID=A0A8K0DVK5_9ROSA|nr:hypothetical protein FNV43_RR21665 [Rhamnella rubrinervis]
MRSLVHQWMSYSSKLQFLDLSWNRLSGKIPSRFDNNDFIILALKSKKLSGSMPSSLSRMSNLEILDFSDNKLIGTIPPSLVKLNFVFNFSVVDNRLFGDIHSGGQFSTFPGSSFEGNDLCGDHVSSYASNDQPFEKPLNVPSTSNNILYGSVKMKGFSWVRRAFPKLNSPLNSRKGIVVLDLYTKLISNETIYRLGHLRLRLQQHSTERCTIYTLRKFGF